MIWALGAGVAVLALAGVAAPWWLPAFAQRRSLRRRAANVAAYRTRLAELEADVAAGVLAADAAASVREELGARLLQDVDALVEPALEPAPGAAASRAPLAVAAVALVAFAAVWYAVAGTWRTQDLIELARVDPQGARELALSRSIADLRERVERAPGDVEAWVWLARSYRSRNSHAEAASAFAKANELRGHQDPDLLVEEGEALTQAQDRSMAGAPAERFRQALALAPSHPQALWYAGIAAMQAGEDRAALGYWEQLLQQPIGEEMRSVLEHSLARLRTRAGMPAPATASPQTAPAPAPAPAAPAAALQLRLDVSVAPALAAQVQPGDTLFVYATDPAGPPMPLAIQRLSADRLPARITLDDSNSMTAGRKLSDLDRWRVIARISRSGNAMPQPGDLEGSVEVAKAAAGKPVVLAITRTR
jgi:cytochrome c-type biogenesis protein CcmH